ncbi:protein E17 [Elephant endotheliotropic herpesvirus 3B]|nr:protein E17 [Elephant endotheliotropic herpesvirus 3B]
MEFFNEAAMKILIEPITLPVVLKFTIGLICTPFVLILMNFAVYAFGILWTLDRLLKKCGYYNPGVLRLAHLIFRYGYCKLANFLKEFLCGACVCSEYLDWEEIYEQEERDQHAFDKCMLSLTRDVEDFHNRKPEDVENPGPDDESGEDRDPCAIRTVIVHSPPGGNRDPLLLEDLGPEDNEQPCGVNDGPTTNEDRPPATVTVENETQVPAPRGD